MSDLPDVKHIQSNPPSEIKKAAVSDEDKDLSTVDEIPVEELLRQTRAFTERITNEDRQRLALELKGSHQPTIQSRAPITIQQFLAGEIDLGSELGTRFAGSPLLSDIALSPKRPDPTRRHFAAIMTSQDKAAMVSIDVRANGGLEATFTYESMLSLRFDFGILEEHEKVRWLDLVKRKSGVAFLWGKERWEKDYMILVMREQFARVYAFSTHRFEAAVRITPDVMGKWLDWLQVFWIKGAAKESLTKRVEEALSKPKSDVAALPETTMTTADTNKVEEPKPQEMSDNKDNSASTNSTFEW